MYLIDRITRKKAIIGVVGLGHVGLPLAKAFRVQEFDVRGFDTDTGKFDDDFPCYQPLWMVDQCDVIIICVGTPLGKNKEPDISNLENVCRSVAKHSRHGTLVILESTVSPGTTEDILLPMLESWHGKAGKDFYLGYSPEREDIQRHDYDVTNMPKVVSGISARCFIATQLLYEHITETVPASNTKTAEMAKTFENAFRLVNISLVNELKMLAHKMDIDMDEVVKITSTRPFGYMAFYPGPGTGGHCVPVDPNYLSWKAKEFKSPTRLIDTAGLIDDSMPEYVVARTAEALNTVGKCLKKSKVLVLGLAYKKNVSDDRGSVSYRIMDLFNDAMALTFCYDPHVETTKYNNLKEVDAYVYNSMDVVVVVVDHDRIDYGKVASHSHLVVDTRNCCNSLLEHVFKA
jgi:UDP-N-acetyl-D-glucosamine dehydrogenase